ncbi:MAG: hypothetical protein IJS28_01600 [Synergistaceae bacterium]|nr:hypothetical protein [Synergistaceae bacterium]
MLAGGERMKLPRKIFCNLIYPYTHRLLRSVPVVQHAEGFPERPHERLIPIEGQPPYLLNPPKGCPYVKRCPHAMRICLEHKPETLTLSDTHSYSCWQGVKE